MKLITSKAIDRIRQDLRSIYIDHLQIPPSYGYIDNLGQWNVREKPDSIDEWDDNYYSDWAEYYSAVAVALQAYTKETQWFERLLNIEHNAFVKKIFFGTVDWQQITHEYLKLKEELSMFIRTDQCSGVIVQDQYGYEDSVFSLEDDVECSDQAICLYSNDVYMDRGPAGMCIACEYNRGAKQITIEDHTD